MKKLSLTKDTGVGAEFTGKAKKLDEARVWAFSGGRLTAPNWPAKNIHTDLEFAKNCGLPSRGASATQYMGYVAELMIDLFGGSWFKTGKMELKFIALVDVNDVLVSKAVVTSKQAEKSGTGFTFDAWCENQHGNKVVVGTASGLLP